MSNHVEEAFLEIFEDLEEAIAKARAVLDSSKPLPELKEIVQEYEDARSKFKRK